MNTCGGGGGKGVWGEGVQRQKRERDRIGPFGWHSFSGQALIPPEAPPPAGCNSGTLLLHKKKTQNHSPTLARRREKSTIWYMNFPCAYTRRSSRRRTSSVKMLRSGSRSKSKGTSTRRWSSARPSCLFVVCRGLRVVWGWLVGVGGVGDQRDGLERGPALHHGARG